MSKRNTSVPQKLVDEKKGKDAKPIRKEEKPKTVSLSQTKQSLPAKRPAGESLSKLHKESDTKKSTSVVKVPAVEMSKDRRRDLKGKFQSLTG